MWFALAEETRVAIFAHIDGTAQIGDIAAVHGACKKYKARPLPVLAYFGWRQVVDFSGTFKRPADFDASGTLIPIEECDEEVQAAWKLYLRIGTGD